MVAQAPSASTTAVARAPLPRWTFAAAGLAAGRDATGELCYKVMHERDSVCPWCVNDRVFAGETVHREMFSPKDNRWFYVVNVPIPHSDGTMSKQSMMLDITGRKVVRR